MENLPATMIFVMSRKYENNCLDQWKSYSLPKHMFLWMTMTVRLKHHRQALVGISMVLFTLPSVA